MTSRLSKNNSTTDDWRSQKNGDYFDSIWPVDSQGRRTPASTQITVTPSASILEISRAAQAANRDKLDRRDNVGRIQTEATRLINKDQSGRQQNKNEITRGVPENEIRTVLPKRRFVGGDFAWIMLEQIIISNTFSQQSGYPQPPNNVQQSSGKLAASNNISKKDTTLNSFTYDDVVYSKSTLPKNSQVYSFCTVIDQTKSSVVFRFSRSLSTTTVVTDVGLGDRRGNPSQSSRERFRLSLGLYLPVQNPSKEGYIYIITKAETHPELSDPGVFWRPSGRRLSELGPTILFPETVITGDPSNIYIRRITVGTIAQVNSTGIVTGGVANSNSSFKEKVRNDFAQELLHYAPAPLQFTNPVPPEIGFMGPININFVLTAFSPSVPLYEKHPGRDPASGIGWQWQPPWYASVPGTYTQTDSFDRTVEIIYTEKDYGPLVLQ